MVNEKMKIGIVRGNAHYIVIYHANILFLEGGFNHDKRNGIWKCTYNFIFYDNGKMERWCDKIIIFKSFTFYEI